MNEWKYKLDDVIYIKHQDSYEDDYGSVVTNYEVFKLVDGKRILFNTTGDLPYITKKCECCSGPIYIRAEYLGAENNEAVEREEAESKIFDELQKQRELKELERLKKKYEL